MLTGKLWSKLTKISVKSFKNTVFRLPILKIYFGFGSQLSFGVTLPLPAYALKNLKVHIPGTLPLHERIRST
jgi:hypothetical protein